MVSAGRNPQGEATVGGAVRRVRLEDALAREEPEPEPEAAGHAFHMCMCFSTPKSFEYF